MFRKHNKLILLIVLLTFIFSMILEASATEFSDVSGDDIQSAAILRLNALGIIDGYEDGTFRPDETITRAEFAKVAISVAGLGDVASGMATIPSPFNDVADADWFNGCINVAAAQGFVKGYTDGSFNPNAEVSQAEVITVLMRIIGYNDKLVGEWPADYIAKASQLDMHLGTFIASKPATRGYVSILASETLDQCVVHYNDASNTFERKTQIIEEVPYTLLDKRE